MVFSFNSWGLIGNGRLWIKVEVRRLIKQVKINKTVTMDRKAREVCFHEVWKVPIVWISEKLIDNRMLTLQNKLISKQYYMYAGIEINIFGLKMTEKSGLEVLKFYKPLYRYLLTCQANSAFLGSFFCTEQQQLWRG